MPRTYLARSRRIVSTTFASATLFAIAGTLAACEDAADETEDAVEEAADSVDDAVEDTGDAIEDTVDDIGG